MRNESFYMKEETYKVIGLCMEVHKVLGKGHSEAVYAEALEYEFNQNNIPYEREKSYDNYQFLKHLLHCFQYPTLYRYNKRSKGFRVFRPPKPHHVQSVPMVFRHGLRSSSRP